MQNFKLKKIGVKNAKILVQKNIYKKNISQPKTANITKFSHEFMHEYNVKLPPKFYRISAQIVAKIFRNYSFVFESG